MKVASPPFLGSLQRELGGGQVIQGGADRLEQGDLIVGGAAGAFAAGQFEEVAGDVVGLEHAAFQGLDVTPRSLSGSGGGEVAITGLADRRRAGRRAVARLGTAPGLFQLLGLAFQLGDLAFGGAAFSPLLAERQPHHQAADQKTEEHAAQHQEKDRNPDLDRKGPEIERNEAAVRNRENHHHHGQGNGQKPGKVFHGIALNDQEAASAKTPRPGSTGGIQAFA